MYKLLDDAKNIDDLIDYDFLVELDKIIDDIKVRKQEENLTKNEMMRLAYLSLGKIFNKHTLLFLSTYNKFKTSTGKIKNGCENIELSIEEVHKIHSKLVSKVGTCKTVAFMLWYILACLEFEVDVIRTADYVIYKHNDNEYKIYHYFVCCEGDDEKKYFMTLNPDLMNIKSGFKTNHFACSRDYIIDGKKTYFGNEIKNSIMSDEEIKEIDMKIGYLEQYDDYNYDYITNLSTQTKDDLISNYNDILITKKYKHFYDGLKKIFKEMRKYNFTDLNEIEENKIKKYILNYGLKGMISYNNIFLLYVDEINRMLKYDGFDEIKLKLETIIRDLEDNKRELFRLKSATINLLYAVDELIKSGNHSEQKELFCNYQKSLKDFQVLFIRKQYMNRNVKKNNRRLFEFLKLAFEYDFNINYIGKSNSLFDLDVYGILEINDFLKEYVKSRVKLNLCYNESFEDRILYSIVLSKEDLKTFRYLIIIYDNNSNEQTYSFTYDPKNNKIDGHDLKTNIIDLSMKYIILSDTVTSKLYEIEMMGYKRKLKNKVRH